MAPKLHEDDEFVVPTVETPKDEIGNCAAGGDDDEGLQIEVDQECGHAVEASAKDDADASTNASINESNITRTTTDSTMRSRSSVKSETMATALTFSKEMLQRMIPLICIVGIFGYFPGALIKGAADDLLDSHEHSNSSWSQIWSDHQDSDLGSAELNNATFVQIYDKVHRAHDVEPSAPKFSTPWIYAYYLRMGVVVLMGYGIPWFDLVMLFGVKRTGKYVVGCFAPLVILVMSYCFAASAHLAGTGDLLISNEFVERIIGFMVASAMALLVLPIVLKQMGAEHPWKAFIFPYLLLWVSLIALRYQVPVYVVGLSNDWYKALFRVFVYEFMKECFIAPTRILLRMIPLDCTEVRPEDKTFVVLGVDCLFAYWGRVIMMDLQEVGPMYFASIGLGLLECTGRITVVMRDRIYLGFLFCSREKGEKFWKANKAAMVRFRCSTVYMHTLLEYLMISSAFWFAAATGAPMWTLIQNVVIQLVAEMCTDGISFYFEIFRHKLPVIVAWNNRHKYWFLCFGVFTVCFNLFAISQSAQYFCAFRNQNRIEVVYCASDK